MSKFDLYFVVLIFDLLIFDFTYLALIMLSSYFIALGLSNIKGGR